MFGIKEDAEERRRRAYFKAHENEEPFPLDGSDFARLIREHQYLEKHQHHNEEPYDDFLARLHAKGSVLFSPVRGLIQKALYHWFTPKEEYHFPVPPEIPTKEELVQKRIDALNDHLVELSDAENDWLAHKSYAAVEPALIETTEGEETSYPAFGLESVIDPADTSSVQDE